MLRRAKIRNEKIANARFKVRKEINKLCNENRVPTRTAWLGNVMIFIPDEDYLEALEKKLLDEELEKIYAEEI